MAIKIKVPIEKVAVRHALDIYELMQLVLKRENKLDLRYEHFWVIALNNDNKILSLELVSMGTTRRTAVEPTQVLSFPLQKCAVGVMLVHNHPSGSLEPSEADKDLTDRLIQACRIMKTPVLDHVIITERSYYSFKDSGLLERLEGSLKYVPKYELEKQYHDEMEREKALILKATEQKIQESLSRGREIGLEQGKVEGKAEGREEGRQEIAKQMLSEGEPIAKIQKWTGLSEEELEGLK